MQGWAQLHVMHIVFNQESRAWHVPESNARNGNPMQEELATHTHARMAANAS